MSTRTVRFTKMQGTGNDFIVIDNRQGGVPDAVKRDLVKAMCQRALSVGADGVIFIENDGDVDFKWDFYNADGSSAEMCGNGARCAAKYASRVGIGAGKKGLSFRTRAGVIQAELTGDDVTIRLTDAAPAVKVQALPVEQEALDMYFINTGVPHAVVPVADLERIDLKRLGAAIRYHAHFAPAGTNVNFMMKEGEGRVALRTYERGVEDETLACGTGSVACAIIATEAFGFSSPVEVRTRSGGVLKIRFTKETGRVRDVYLEGPAVIVYTGEYIFTEA